jgi:hypothetical protein
LHDVTQVNYLIYFDKGLNDGVIHRLAAAAVVTRGVLQEMQHSAAILAAEITAGFDERSTSGCETFGTASPSRPYARP